LLEHWRLDLESWAIPPEILAGATESPWVLPRQMFSRRAERRQEAPSGPSFERAWEALRTRGSVLDVGAGAGAACLPLAPRASEITAVDSDAELLQALAEIADRLGVSVREVHGRWPDVADDVGPADVVTCHHVLYNVADLEPFVRELTSHARRRVVVEITARHPLAWLNPLWQRFHGYPRPDAPTAGDAVAIIEALGLAPSHLAWSRPGETEHESLDELVEVVRRRLCVQPSRAGEVAEALGELGIEAGSQIGPGSGGTDLVTIWWTGAAR